MNHTLFNVTSETKVEVLYEFFARCGLDEDLCRHIYIDHHKQIADWADAGGSVISYSDDTRRVTFT